MKLTIKNQIGQAQIAKKVVSTWRKDPTSLNNAANAAYYYAKKEGERMIVVPGDNRGIKVYHIARENESVVKYTGPKGWERYGVVVVMTDGRCMQGYARD